MKNFLTITFSLMTLTALAAPWQCVQTKEECRALRDKGIECLPLDNQAIVAIYGNDVGQCTRGILNVYEAKETAKYKARNGGQNPRADYFDYSSSTLGNGQTGSANSNLLVYGGLGALLVALVVWVVSKMRK